MSFTSKLKGAFNNFGHAIAAGAKYFAGVLVPEAVSIANKAQALQPEADALLAAIAGPHAVEIQDLAFRIFGEVANGLVPLSQDQLAAVQANGLNLQLDTQVVNDVKQFAALIQSLLAARGTPAPSPSIKK